MSNIYGNTNDTTTNDITNDDIIIDETINDTNTSDTSISSSSCDEQTLMNKVNEDIINDVTISDTNTNDITNDNYKSIEQKYISYFEYLDQLLIARDKSHVDNKMFPSVQETILLYTCFLFSDIFGMDNKKLYMLDIIIINKIYIKILKHIVNTQYMINKHHNDNEQTKINSYENWKYFLEHITYEILMFHNKLYNNDIEPAPDKIMKYFSKTEEVVLYIISKYEDDIFEPYKFIYNYDKKLLPTVFFDYMEKYMEYYMNLHNINIKNDCNDTC